jgi:hypothetical protein
MASYLKRLEEISRIIGASDSTVVHLIWAFSWPERWKSRYESAAAELESVLGWGYLKNLEALKAENLPASTIGKIVRCRNRMAYAAVERIDHLIETGE